MSRVRLAHGLRVALAGRSEVSTPSPLCGNGAQTGMGPSLPSQAQFSQAFPRATGRDVLPFLGPMLTGVEELVLLRTIFTWEQNQDPQAQEMERH